jgi:hypothetical protein
MSYSGIDLPSNNSVAVVVTDEQDLELEEKRVANHLAVIVKLLEPHREDLAAVVVESIINGYWLVDGLMEAGYAVKLANPAAIKKYAGLKYSGDETDARHVSQPAIGARGPANLCHVHTALDTRRHQRSSGAAQPPERWQTHRRSLDPDGCLARFVRSHDSKKRARKPRLHGAEGKTWATCTARVMRSHLTRAG